MSYITFPEYKIKLLIDSGSTKSFIDPNIAFKLFPKEIISDPFIVSTVFQQSSHKYSMHMPASRIFNLPAEKKLKFYLFKFHNIFDGLIGLDNLKLLQASINYDKGFITTPHARIKLQFHQTQNQVNNITISARSEQVVKIKTNVLHGDIIIPYQKLHNCEIPNCLTVARNGYAITTILNNTCQPVTLDVSQPFYAEKFNFDDIEKIEVNNFNDTEVSHSYFDPNKIRTEHMNEEEKSKVLALCKEFSDIFYHEGMPLTFTNKIKHSIKLTDEQPVYTKSYRYPQIYKKEVESQINKMLAQKIIRPSDSPWSAPIWVVPKKPDASGIAKFRVVVDFRNLNAKTIDQRWPLPNITDLLDKLGKCQYFTTLDLASGFHQIQMEEKDIEKTAFSTENGHYEFLRMPFGLKNAPATFQKVMDGILRGIQNEKCLVYLDDIIIFSTSLQEHLERLREVFKRLRESNFKIQLDKSEFLRREVAYLGHMVTPDGVRPNPDKILAIKNYPIPTTTKQIKGFLGLLGYYRRFIKNFAKITKPLTKCLKKGAKIEHNNEFIECFETCKKLLSNQPILQYPDFDKPFNLTCDASNVALGAVLSQGPIGQDLPIAYASRTLNDSERNYSTIEKECLCLVWATKYFRPYLYGRKFKIITDHKPLQWLFNLKDPSSKLLRWRMKLEEYDYQIIYKKGKLNTNADALSRIEIHAKETSGEKSDISPLVRYIEEFNKELENGNDNPTENENMDQISIIAQPDQDRQDQLDNDAPGNNDNGTIHSNDEEDPIVGIPIIESAVNYGANQVIISQVFHSPAKTKRIILFEKKRRFIVQLSEDNFDNDVVQFIKEHIVPDKLYSLYFENPDTYEPFCEVVRKNFKWPSLRFKRCLIKLIDVTEKTEIPDIIRNYHESKTNHRGIEETEKRIKDKYYWPNLKESIQTFINECEICQKSKYERHPVKIEMNITPTATRPFDIVHIDTFTLDKMKFLTIIDSFSKYAQAYSLNSINATEIADNLITYFSHHGIPTKIIVDNGTEFKNTVVTELLQLHKIKIHFCSPNHPQSNGAIERLHSTLTEHVRLLNNQGFLKTPISQKMKYAILAYNNTIHSITNFKPIDVINGHISTNDPFNMQLDQMLLTDYVADHKTRTKLLYSKINEQLINMKEAVIGKINTERDKPSLFSPGQQIYVKKHTRQKLGDKFTPPTQVESINPMKKTVSTPTQGKIHMDNLKRPLRNKYSFDT